MHQRKADRVPRLRQATGARTVAARDADLCVGHGEWLSFGGHRIEVLATPGRTADSVGYRVGRRVFTGDALLVARVTARLA